MAAFEYRALDGRGKEKKGLLEADTAKQIRQQLRDKGLMPIAVELAASQEKANAAGNVLFQQRQYYPTNSAGSLL